MFFFLVKANKQEYLLRLRSRLQDLPDENYALLRYIICFLVAVASHQDVNKMGPMALAIVFGPNIFRYGEREIITAILCNNSFEHNI